MPFFPAPSGPPVTWKQAIELPSGTTKHFEAYLPAAGSVSAQIVAASGPHSGKVLATAKGAPATASGPVSVLIVSDDPAALSALGVVGVVNFSGQQSLVRVAPAAVPASPAALAPFALVIVDDATTDVLTAAQRAALEGYVSAGGSHAVTGGDAAQKTVAGLPADLVAVSGITTQSLPGLSAAATELGAPAFASPLDVAAGTVARGGVVDIGEGTTPILVEASHGGGRIFYLGAEPDTNPVASWPGAVTLLPQLRVRAVGYNEKAGPESGLNPTTSVPTLGGSLYEALANIPSLDLPSPALLALILAVFILLVGPVNYVVLRRLHRPDFAWVTVPLLVAVSAGSIYGFGLAAKGSNVLADQVKVVYLQPGSRAFVTEGVGVFSPHSGSHTISTSAGSSAAPLSSQVAPGIVLGGTGEGSEPITLNVGSPQTVTMSWSQADSIETFGESYEQTLNGGLSAHLTVANGRLSGSITNNLSEPIDDAVALSGTGHQLFGAIRPGGSVTVNLPLPTGTVTTTFGASLADQIYLGSSSPCLITAACGLAPALVNTPVRPTAAQRQRERRAQVLNGILASNPTSSSRSLSAGPRPRVVLCWSTASRPRSTSWTRS